MNAIPSAKQIGWTVSLCAAMLSGCRGSPDRVEPPQIDPYGAAERALAEFDANGDGRIGSGELDACPGLKAAAKAVDTDNDGALSAEEIATRIQQWSADRVALVAVNCRLVRKGQPLPEATITFVPEKFLGPNIKPASGVSDRSGRVELTVAGVPVKGLSHCGFFRIEISKKKDGRDMIPAKFNRETVLGEEIIEGDKQRLEGFVFDMSAE